MQLAEDNMSAVQQPTESNVPMSQDQGIDNSAESSLNTLAIPYDNNQLANLDLWDSFFALTSLLEVKKFLNSDVQNITCSLFRIRTFIK